MRGEGIPTMDVQRAAVLLDLTLAGVHAELGEVPLGVVGWEEQPATAAVAAVEKRLLPAASAAPVQPAPVAAAEEAPPAGEVWSEGEAGGVVLVVQGQRVADCDALVTAMLAAVGCASLPVARVGMVGKVEAREVAAKVEAMAPQRILVLGQGPLSVLTGRNIGVEGWQAAGGPVLEALGGAAAVGVTYPPEMLMKQPLFKRLAWQHLLAWQQRFATV